MWSLTELYAGALLPRWETKRGSRHHVKIEIEKKIRETWREK